MASIEFWFDFASTYSHLAALRIEQAAQGLHVVWRPFLLGPLFAEQQRLSDSPFNANPLRGQHMWRDLERQSAKYGVPYRRPSAFPRNSTLAARVAVAAAGEPWLPDYCRSVFRANFVDNREIADRQVIESILGEHRDFIARDKKGALRARTDEARRRGLFGAPSFFVSQELYFGNDRLDDALAFARSS